ncbi:photosystem reaction center subunit H [Sphingomonas oleivorans]|uniref:Photosystem reaction center subunit H n=1 Tax=Sphingomonas oleivorans TaxID=1735121 RepID=A0A2T5FW76_9SPHN|nr:PRC-barrel domain-containing protein [Sphingomonas oleivorans]PTQ10019.1 photosystem reaction center subunit H [Sphingomonas oleivorans]
MPTDAPSAPPPSAPSHATKPTSRLVASDRVEGAAVYARDGHKLGTVRSFIIDRISGQIVFVVMSVGGFLGLGQKYHPLPWDMLAYDEFKDGYVINFDLDMLHGSPSYRPDDAPEFDEAYGQRIATYYMPSRKADY